MDDYAAAYGIGLLAADVCMLVDKEHPALLGNKASQLPPEPFEPAGWHVRQPEREEDGVEPRGCLPGEHIGDLEPDVGGRDPAARDIDHFGGGFDRCHRGR